MEYMIKLSDYVMNFLVSKGVSKVFMITGGGAMHLNDSIGHCEKLEYFCFSGGLPLKQISENQQYKQHI